MKNIHLIGLLVLGFGLACEFEPTTDQPPNCTPTASFEPSHFDREIGLPISVVNVSPVSTEECPYRYSWDFGDDSGTKEGQDPGPHIYAAESLYIITLTVSAVNPPFETRTFSREVRIFDPAGPPVAVPQASPASCFGPCTVTLNATASTGNIDVYHWDLGYDGQEDEGATITHTFPPSRDSYQVRLTVSNSEDNSSETIAVDVNWLTFVHEGIEMQSLGPAIHLSRTSTDRYHIVGSKDLGNDAEGIYSLLADEHGQLVGDPVVLDNLSNEDVVHDAVRLASNGDIVLVGSTLEDDLNSILFVRFNPLAPANPTLLSLGDLNRREVGRAVHEVVAGGQVSLAVVGEIFDAAGYAVYFNLLTLTGSTRLPAAQVVRFPGVSVSLMEVKDVVRTSNGHYWVCGWLDDGTGDLSQAFLLELDSEGVYANHRLLGSSDELDQFFGMSTNAAADQILVVGTSFDFDENSSEMIYAVISQHDITGGSLQRITNRKLTVANSARLLADGGYLIGGTGDDGSGLAILRTDGSVVHVQSYGGFVTDQFFDGISCEDGGYAAVGTKGSKILFVKTDDQLGAN